jgi:CMP-N,N'-diacetyllegionaminic acid synthase
MRILALIPARGGSNRLPGKNKKLLAGKPLINWTIELAKTSASICDIVVSTDDPEIAGLAISAQVKVPWLRPKELSTDSSSSAEVAVHTLDWYESHVGAVDGLLLLQPTSPFRSKETIERAVSMFEEGRKRPILGVSAESAHLIYWLTPNGEISKVDTLESDSTSQYGDSVQRYRPNGLIYLNSPNDLRRTQSFLGENAIPLICNSQIEAIDIDTQEDWDLAELVARIRNQV